MQLVLTSEILLEAYRQGLFPMAYSSGSPFIHWVCPEMRGQLSIVDMHIPKSLKKTTLKTLRSDNAKIAIDRDFQQVIEMCAEEHDDRPETWINDQIIDAFINLHEQGHAHSVEYWEGGELKGGLYGLKIGGLFCGESMFSRTPNASKIALVHLVARLWKGGFRILDTQFVNEHLAQFGVYELAHKIYAEQVKKAVEIKADFALEGMSEEQIIRDYFEMRKSR